MELGLNHNLNDTFCPWLYFISALHFRVFALLGQDIHYVSVRAGKRQLTLSVH